MKWQDIDFAEAEIRVVRSVVDQVEGPPKTLASRRPVPMSSELASALENLRKHTDHWKPEDWVWASPQALGKLAYWPSTVMNRHVRIAALDVGRLREGSHGGQALSPRHYRGPVHRELKPESSQRCYRLMSPCGPEVVPVLGFPYH